MRIVIHDRYAEQLRAALEIAASVESGATDAEVGAMLPGADVLVSSVYLSEWAAAGAGLRLIHATGAGCDSIAFDAVPARCQVANVYEHEGPVAEYVFMAMAALDRELLAADGALRRGIWLRGPVRELRGRRLLIVGLGHIGREVARWAGVAGMPVNAVTQRPSEARRLAAGLEVLGGLADLESLAADADFLVVAIASAHGTTGLVGPRVLAAMRPGAFLINVGRGPVVDEQALYDALARGRLAGAAIDVWYRYPKDDGPVLPATAPFHQLGNVILTPHNAGYTIGTVERRMRSIAANIGRLARGERVDRLVQAP